MDSQRNFLFIIFLFVSFIIWQFWQIDKNSSLVDKNSNIKLNNNSNLIEKDSNIELNNNSNLNSINNNFYLNQRSNKIKIKTDVLSVLINLRGGDVEQAKLLTYADKLNSLKPFSLLETTPYFTYQAQSGLITQNLDNIRNNKQPLYHSKNNQFIMKSSMDELKVPLVWISKNGIIYKKIFVFKRGEYVVNIKYSITNNSNKNLKLLMFGELKQTFKLPKYRDSNINNFALKAFRGAAFSTTDNKYEKYKFENINKNINLNVTTNNGWIAMIQQYFATAWIPQNNGLNTFYTRKTNNDILAIGYRSSPLIIDAGQKKKISALLWLGPEIQDKMSIVAPYLDLTVDYGWLWFISQPLFKLLKFLHKFIGNWGFSIVVITFIVKFITYPLTKVQYTSMAKIRKLQPKIQKIRDHAGDDKQKISQEIMLLYKSEKVNPLGGCLPLLIQMPIFLALYYMLMSSIELRHAPFCLWIYDLSAQDPYYISPILMGLTMLIIQKTSPNTINDPVQQKIITYMPIIFTIFFLWFPSGLVIYYIVSNLVTIIQQQVIYNGLEKQGLHIKK